MTTYYARWGETRAATAERIDRMAGAGDSYIIIPELDRSQLHWWVNNTEDAPGYTFWLGRDGDHA